MSQWELDKDIGWDCDKCVKLKGKQEQRGCHSETGPVWTMGGTESRRCPKARLLLDTDPQGLIQIFNFSSHYRNGILPVGGGIMEQPAIAIQLLDTCLEEINRLENEAVKKERAKLKEPVIKRGNR